MEILQNIGFGETVRYLACIVGFLSIFVEVSKVKINPVSAVLGWVGKRINVDLMKKIEEQEKAIQGLSEDINDNEIDRIRWEVLDFANSCRNGRKHTKDEFEHIIEQNAKYHKILDRRGLQNGVLDLEYSYIQEIYQKCQRENSFL